MVFDRVHDVLERSDVRREGDAAAAGETYRRTRIREVVQRRCRSDIIDPIAGDANRRVFFFYKRLPRRARVSSPRPFRLL